MNKQKQIIETIQLIEKQRDSLKSQLNLGIITIDDAREESNMLNKKEFSLKEKFVCENHITLEGRERKISHHLPTENNPKDYYATKIASGNKITASTYENLIEKLYDFYSSGDPKYSLKEMFNQALVEKEVTENPNKNTLYKNRADYNRFVTEEFGAKDIRYIKDIDIKIYLQNWVNTKHPKKKTYLAFKGTLNLIFDYAFSHGIIEKNPMTMVKNKPYMKSCDTRKANPEEKILTPEEIQSLKDEVRYRMTMPKWGHYYINGFAMLFAIETGVRVGELCALQWEDIKSNCIHIHRQQLSEYVDGVRHYYLVDYTKNEKGESEDGRDFPLTQNLKDLLAEIRYWQNLLNINSEFVFCHEDGNWIKKDAYITFLRRLCTSKNLKVTNNHAFRMSLNSNVLIPLGVSVADRAAMLGHSIETNLRHYSFAQKDYLDNVCSLLDSVPLSEQVTPETFKVTPNIIDFKSKQTSKGASLLDLG